MVTRLKYAIYSKWHYVLSWSWTEWRITIKILTSESAIEVVTRALHGWCSLRHFTWVHMNLSCNAADHDNRWSSGVCACCVKFWSSSTASALWWVAEFIKFNCCLHMYLQQLCRHCSTALILTWGGVRCIELRQGMINKLAIQLQVNVMHKT